MRRVCTAVLMLVLALAGTGMSTAYAGTSCSATQDFSLEVEQALCHPLPVGSAFAIDGPRNVWQMRALAERLDAELPGLDYVGACTADPTAFCITVVKVDELDGNDGLATWNPDWSGARLDLRRGSGPRDYRRGVAAHELMHVLGFTHHVDDGGLVGPTVQVAQHPTPSDREWQVLRTWYAGVEDQELSVREDGRSTHR